MESPVPSGPGNPSAAAAFCKVPRQQHTQCRTHSHTPTHLIPNSNKSPVHQHRGQALDGEQRAAGQGLDTLAKGRADLRRLY